MKKDIFTTFDISRMLRVNPTTVQNWARNKTLPSYATPGGHRRVRREDLLAFIRKFNFPLPSELAGEKNRVLIVDGEPATLDDLRSGIIRQAEAEWEVFTSRNGMEALLLFGEVKPDLVILDVSLPDLDGCELCRLFKERSPEIRIISISSQNEETIIQKTLAMGADRCMTKPLQMATMVQSMQRLVSGKGARI